MGDCEVATWANSNKAMEAANYANNCKEQEAANYANNGKTQEAVNNCDCSEVLTSSIFSGLYSRHSRLTSNIDQQEPASGGEPNRKGTEIEQRRTAKPYRKLAGTCTPKQTTTTLGGGTNRALPNPQSAIRNPQSPQALPNPQSAIRNPQSSRNPKSEIRNPKFPLAIAVILLAFASPAMAQTPPAPAPATQPSNGSVPEVSDLLKAVDKATNGKDGKPNDWSAPVKLAVVFTFLALLPSVLVMMTSFTRIIIVLSFIRRALTTQSIPPTIALIGLALFLTLFTMSPTFARINQDALAPYVKDQIPMDVAAGRANNLLKEFMVRQTRPADLELFLNLANMSRPEKLEDLPSFVAIPAFAISEFRKSFEMGCLLFIPFLIVDLVVGAILLSAGMMMLPPAMISLPFKIILFVLVDGWRLLAQTLVGSFKYG